MKVSVLDLTAIETVAAAWRPRPSEALIGMFFAPGFTLLPTPTVAVNVCSPVLALAPVNAHVPGPPMLEKSPVTERFVSAGLLPGLTTTVNVTLPPCAASAGSAVELVIEGGVDGVAQLKIGDAVLRGVGAPMVKSVELTSVSVQPLEPRIAAVVLLSPAVGAPSEQLAVPYPTASTTPADVTQLPAPIKVVLLTRTTLPDAALIAMLPEVSGVGSAAVSPTPAASCTR